jgi:signal recognition particle subunit SEC65
LDESIYSKAAGRKVPKRNIQKQRLEQAERTMEDLGVKELFPSDAHKGGDDVYLSASVNKTTKE